MQVVLDGGNAFSITWQVLPYALLTLGEVLVAATGLEFAYSQAPQAMKGALMAFWYLSVTIGNLWVLVVNAAVKNTIGYDFIASMASASRHSRCFSSPHSPSSPRSRSASSPGPIPSSIIIANR